MNTSAAYHAFLSYSSLDRPVVLKIADELNKRGCTCFLDQWYLAPGRDWVGALEKALAASRSVAVFLGSGEMGRWQQRERAWALDRYAENPQQFAVIPVLLPGWDEKSAPLGFLKQMTWIDLRENSTDAAQLDRLAAAIRGEPVNEDGQRQPRATICPYRGLLYFREEDAAFFFGRDTYIQQLADKVERHNLVAVVGASGSGKSSVVRAGLVPRLRARERQPVWEIATMRPGVDPLHSLADVLLPFIEPELSGIELVEKRTALSEKLKSAKTPLWDLVAEALRQQKGTDRLLLVVDQWEELYTQCEDATARQRFIEELLAATARKQSPLSVVLTVRSDFYTHLLQNRPLLDQLQDGKLDLGPMTRDELREAIEKPAVQVGLAFQDGLVDHLLYDAREEPGRLPLLEFALEELWKHQDHGQLTHNAYAALGRLSGAIANRAEEVFGKLKAEEQAAARALFRRLVRAGAKTEEDTRRRADVESLDGTSQAVVRRLTDERLLVTTRVETSGGSATETVEVAHDELLRRWSRLRAWIDGRIYIGTSLRNRAPRGTYLVELPDTQSMTESPPAAMSRGDFRDDDPGDSVDCTVFAPPTALRGDSIMVQVWAHLPEAASEVQRKANEFDDESRPRGETSLGTRIRHGSTLTFRIIAEHLEGAPHYATIVWQGKSQAVQFTISVPENFAHRVVIGTVHVYQDDVQIGDIRFKLALVDPYLLDSQRRFIGHARRFTRAFVSYESSDLRAVLSHTQTLKSVGIKVFQDILCLDPGVRWARKLFELIDLSDVFFLFWSTAAKDSEWVEREWRYCLDHKGAEYICPIVLEGPPIPTPPPELEHLQFGDPILRLVPESTWQRIRHWFAKLLRGLKVNYGDKAKG